MILFSQLNWKLQCTILYILYKIQFLAFFYDMMVERLLEKNFKGLWENIEVKACSYYSLIIMYASE